MSAMARTLLFAWQVHSASALGGAVGLLTRLSPVIGVRGAGIGCSADGGATGRGDGAAGRGDGVPRLRDFPNGFLMAPPALA